MPLTVKQLIKALRKYPEDSLASTDNGADELEGHVVSVYAFDPKKSFDENFCKNTYVVLKG